MFYFLLFLSAFRSVDIIFHKFLELHAVLLVNFFNEFTQTPATPLMAKIQYVSQKFFVDAPLIVTNNQISCLYKTALCQLI